MKPPSPTSAGCGAPSTSLETVAFDSSSRLAAAAGGSASIAIWNVMVWFCAVLAMVWPIPVMPAGGVSGGLAVKLGSMSEAFSSSLL